MNVKEAQLGKGFLGLDGHTLIKQWHDTLHHL